VTSDCSTDELRRRRRWSASDDDAAPSNGYVGDRVYDAADRVTEVDTPRNVGPLGLSYTLDPVGNPDSDRSHWDDHETSTFHSLRRQ